MMLTKIVPFIRATPHVQQIYRQGHGVPAHWKPMRQICEENKNHMNCMPVPEGCWQEAYNKKNARWNQLLLGSILSLIITGGILWKSGVLYLHSSPPMFNCKKS